ncbi:hypothetical protein [Paenibacillus sp. URB8-2]|uniref:hypothetical protein n=1 Tax=Paenibacillus sp. URB8-2 TaxID=2741301 RepID=UPI0015BE418D|nr:hypothetical protein [Paenibacillus sp. URB8-2]BCG58255.1 hypothetical protein PUR_16800 [Paenibacillus sp. URB8-2]
MDGFTKKEWIDYLNKLQDNERKKMASSGLNNWTLLVAVSGISYPLVKQFLNIDFFNRFTLLGFVISLNILISLFDVINVEFRFRKVSHYRKANSSDLGKLIKHITNVFETFAIFISIIFNLVALFEYPEFTIVFVVFLFRYCQNLINTLFGDRIVKYIEKNKGSQIQNKDGYPTFIHRIMLYGFFIISFIPLKYTKSINHSEVISQAFINGLFLLVVLVLLFLLLKICIKKLKIAWLEEMEKQVVFDKIELGDIKQTLESGYFSIVSIEDIF